MKLKHLIFLVLSFMTSISLFASAHSTQTYNVFLNEDTSEPLGQIDLLWNKTYSQLTLSNFRTFKKSDETPSQVILQAIEDWDGKKDASADLLEVMENWDGKKTAGLDLEKYVLNPKIMHLKLPTFRKITSISKKRTKPSKYIYRSAEEPWASSTGTLIYTGDFSHHVEVQKIRKEENSFKLNYYKNLILHQFILRPIL